MVNAYSAMVAADTPPLPSRSFPAKNGEKDIFGTGWNGPARAPVWTGRVFTAAGNRVATTRTAPSWCGGGGADRAWTGRWVRAGRNPVDDSWSSSWS